MAARIRNTRDLMLRSLRLRLAAHAARDALHLLPCCEPQYRTHASHPRHIRISGPTCRGPRRSIGSCRGESRALLGAAGPGPPIVQAWRWLLRCAGANERPAVTPCLGDFPVLSLVNGNGRTGTTAQ